MPRRSIRIQLSNSTDFPLKLLGTSLCHGIWTEGPNGEMQPKDIEPKTSDVWESESSGIGKGTEGWVKYSIQNTITSLSRPQPCQAHLVYIHWENPFRWDESTKPYDGWSSFTSDVVPPCDADKGGWTFQASSKPPPDCRYELFVYSKGGQEGLKGITWWDIAVNWPFLLVFIAIGATNINLEFTVGLRQEGSIAQTIFPAYDGSGGLRALTTAAGQPSLRSLLAL